MALKLGAIGLVLIVSCTAQQFYANTRYGKRDDISSVDKLSYGTARQGRSDAKVDVAVRNDRFFIGSRYGKRSNDIPTEQNMGRKWGEFHSGNDGFIFGSRYGKRDRNLQIGTYASSSKLGCLNVSKSARRFALTDNVHILTPRGEEDQFAVAEPSDEKNQMSCIFTGIGVLYNCFPMEKSAKAPSPLL